MDKMFFLFFFNKRDIHDDEIEDDIREAFRCFDKDGHGFIPIAGSIINIWLPIQLLKEGKFFYLNSLVYEV